MSCPSCQTTGSKALSEHAARKVIVRVRACQLCGARWVTVEKAIEKSVQFTRQKGAA